MLDSTWTYGVELEFADVDRRTPLPLGSSWNTKDYTICNTGGVGNDPTGQLWPYGGEINTQPTVNIPEQCVVIHDIIAALHERPPTINYRCNLHCHVGIPGLKDDLASLQKIERYFVRHAATIFKYIQPIPVPLASRSHAAHEGAVARYKRRLRSHQWVTPAKAHAACMAAKTPQEFFDAYSPKDAKGRVLHHLAIRSAVNIRQLMDTGTIEFRHFAGTLDLVQYETCLNWCRLFLFAALQDRPVEQLLSRFKTEQFPKFEPYRHDWEEIYQLTNFGSNSRKQVAANLERLKAEGQI